MPIHEATPVERPHKPWLQLVFALGEAVLSLISGGILFVVISRVSGPAPLGTYALALAWLALFQGISSFGIPEFILRESGAHRPTASRQIVNGIILGFCSGLFAMGLMVLVAMWTGYSREIISAISVSSLALVPAFLNSVSRSVFVARRQMMAPFSVALLETTIVVSFSLVLVLMGHGAVALLTVLVVAKSASAVLSTTLLLQKVRPTDLSIDLHSAFLTAKTVFVFGIGNMVGMLSRRVNVIILSFWAGIDTVGHYAAATKVMEFGLIAPELFAQLLMTRVAHSFLAVGNRNPNAFAPWYRLVLTFSIPACVGTWIFADLILTSLFGRPFADAVWILRILALYMLTETIDIVMSAILKAANRQRDDVACLACNLAANVTFTLACLPALGPLAPAFGRVGGGLVSVMLRYVLIARALTRLEWVSLAVKPALISTSIGAACFCLANITHPVLLMVAYVIVTSALLQLASSFSLSAVKDIMSPAAAPD